MKQITVYSFYIFSIFVVFASENKSKGLIDLGRGEVISDIQGAQYLQRIRGSFEDRVKGLVDIIDDETFSELEARHLKIALHKGRAK